MAKLNAELGPPSAYQHYQVSTRSNKMDGGPREEEFTYRLLWIESFCEDVPIVQSNFLRIDRHLREDYRKKSDEEALDMFWKKVEHFNKDYETLSCDDDDEYEDELSMLLYNSFIKIIDFGATLILHHVQGFLESKIATFCSYIHTEHRAIVLVRHGQSEFNVEDRLGGDSPLTAKGEEFASNLAEFMEERLQADFRETSTVINDDNVPRLSIWTSNLLRTRQTGEKVEGDLVSWVALSEMDAGNFESMTYEEIERDHHAEYSRREGDKLNYRYPQGESYVDVKKRIQSVLFELERQRNHVLVISHRAGKRLSSFKTLFVTCVSYSVKMFVFIFHEC